MSCFSQSLLSSFTAEILTSMDLISAAPFTPKSFFPTSYIFLLFFPSLFHCCSSCAGIESASFCAARFQLIAGLYLTKENIYSKYNSKKIKSKIFFKNKNNTRKWKVSSLEGTSRTGDQPLQDSQYRWASYSHPCACNKIHF